MPHTETKNIHFTLNKKDDGIATMGVHWTQGGHQTGVWVRYTRETSHKNAFSMLCQGMWEAMQDPDNYNVEQSDRGEMTVPAYWDNVR